MQKLVKKKNDKMKMEENNEEKEKDWKNIGQDYGQKLTHLTVMMKTADPMGPE